MRQLNLLHCKDAARASRAETRRAHLLDVTRKLFAEHGFHATGMARIASVSGIGVGQIYRDFQSKEDIIAALVGVDLAGFLDEAGLAAAVGQGDLAAVRCWVARFIDVDGSVEKCRIMAEIVAEAGRNARIAEIHAAIDGQVRDSLMTALTALVPDTRHAGRRRLLADLVLTLGNGLIHRRLADPGLDAGALTRYIAGIIDREIEALGR